MLCRVSVENRYSFFMLFFSQETQQGDLQYGKIP